MGPYAGADYCITLLYLIVDFEVQISTLTTTNTDERFLYYSKMKQLIGKGRKRETGGKGWKLTLWFRMYISWRRGSHHGGKGHTMTVRVTP